jgi:hypothetical protein
VQLAQSTCALWQASWRMSASAHFPASARLPARRDALAASRMLGRVLALPTLLCWCDFDEHPHILVACRIK